MQTLRVNGIDLYHEQHGSGEPLLLIMGWGANAATWQPQIPGLAQHYRVIAFDNRGVGRSGAPEEPYSIALMAEDAAGLLDALHIRRAHVFGVSMGGMIAQELALRHPERVNTLVLGCTSAGGSAAAGVSRLRAEIDEFRDNDSGGLPDLDWLAEFMKRLWSDAALTRSGNHVQDFVLSFIRFPPTPHGLRHQAAAVAAHDAYDRLPGLRHPTLIVAGTQDRLIDPLNSMILSERIPKSEFHAFPGLRHAFHLEEPDLVNSVIIDFIERRSGGSAAAAAG